VDVQTFEWIVSTYYEPLYRFAYSLSRQESEACDLTQETFYKWATKGHQLRDKSKIKSWLFTTLYRQFVGQQRRETRFPHLEVDAISHELPKVASTVDRDADGATVLSLLGQVSELYRAPLVLLYLEDHSYREIADILDIPIGTVMSRLSRGKELLRLLLASPAAHAQSDANSNITPLNPERDQSRHSM
jgi:RNA polymerase sigma-70 factor (ECF subfamily)